MKNAEIIDIFSPLYLPHHIYCDNFQVNNKKELFCGIK